MISSPARFCAGACCNRLQGGCMRVSPTWGAQEWRELMGQRPCIKAGRRASSTRVDESLGGCPAPSTYTVRPSVFVRRREASAHGHIALTVDSPRIAGTTGCAAIRLGLRLATTVGRAEESARRRAAHYARNRFIYYSTNGELARRAVCRKIKNTDPFCSILFLAFRTPQWSSIVVTTAGRGVA